MQAIQSPRDLFYYDLCTMYDAEQKLVQVLPQLAQECQNNQARDAFTQHEQETRQHVRNLEQCFQILGSQPMALENHTINGLKQDHDTFVQQQPPREALTMYDIDAGYQSEHIEMAAYYRLIDAAHSMGLQQCVQLFQQNLQQDEAEAKKLAIIAHQLNQQAAVSAQAPQQGQPYAPGNVPPPMGQPNVAPSPQEPGQGYGTASAQTPGQGDAPAPGQSNAPASASAPGQGGAPTSGQSYTSTSPRTSLSSQLQPGMRVIGSDNGSIGQVRDVRENDFLIDLPMKRDAYVPFDAIEEVTIDLVALNIPSDQVGTMGWDNPPLTGA
jgi:ferritin-like metal-binding protein YciE